MRRGSEALDGRCEHRVTQSRPCLLCSQPAAPCALELTVK